MRWARAGWLAAALAAAALAATSCLPRMRQTPGLRPYEQRLPELPAGSVARDPVFTPVPSAQEAVKLTSPLSPSPNVLSAGGRYYSYYCQHCHGPDGQGRTPVGEAYDPKPTDLSAPQVAVLGDGALYRGMLMGRGHEPVLEATVPADRRWPIVAYVRTLARPAAPGPSRPRGKTP